MINQVTLVGRLTKDPVLRYTVEGTPVLNVTLAINRHYRNSKGDFEADFVLCTLWNKSAENTAKYCTKGSLIGIMGRIQTRNYDGQDGKKVYVTEVIADSVKFMGGRPAEVDKKEDEKELLPF
ncbi:single-stranded DNA-binding protein [Bacillus sp. FJAT-49732]|uniref:Single-stranded DNA-binding protein n=1 Tax=Lederbergia citrisecunda TaxID=2833583 RepID=A0A942YKR2_9BACI|nr:single-stranded DNA-binding protein [Lederbergia citrisecunda]MBS4200673.1 single-stranded DNA-binding protein [Lederbergia citrisecunda]